MPSRSASRLRPTSPTGPRRGDSTAATSAAGSAGWSAITSPRSSRATGPAAASIPAALTSYIAGRQDYDYNSHGKAGNAHTDFVPDEIIDRFCLIGPVDEQIARLRQLEALGVDQFAVYLQHDAKDVTLAAYGEKVIPAINARIAAKS